jgi:2-phospho-L-lactate guanylyltransferase
MNTAMPSVSAVIPVKPLEAALGRLAGVLPAGIRRDLQWEMLESVLWACARSAALEGVIVVTGDAGVAGLSRSLGARVVPDHAPPRGMNPAVSIGCAAAHALGADAALVLTADLPLLAPRDIDAIIALSAPHPSVVLAPSRDGTGTNAMLLRDPCVMEPRLGPGSLALHEGQAHRRGLPVVRCALAGVALDIDTPEDLEELERCAPDWLATRGIMEGAITGWGA